MMAGVPDTRPNNPRRPPAHKSVSLRHSFSPQPDILPSAPSSQKPRSRVPSSNQANPPSSPSSNPEIRKESSGESSNAERWFERSNNNVQANIASTGDLEPPLFLKNSSSSETPPDVVDRALLEQAKSRRPTVPYRDTLLHVDTQGSSSEDFRSVIDDLTVENMKLKRKLKKYEKLYDAHLQQEKLFEIRVHGLPSQKKRELEETLRKFALSLDSTQQADLSSAYEGSTSAGLKGKPTASSHASTRFADSAYQSNTASGQGSTQQSLAQPADGGSTRKISKHATAASRNQDIQTYLHDIPSTQHPRQPVVMTEKAKRKLIVRRLEQIFAGKGAATSGHQQPLQQQEVSQSAAHADRIATEAAGQPARVEGLREARLMADPVDSARPTQPAVQGEQFDGVGTSGKRSPDQRPTRPLDLDLHRAQVPQDNIDYFRHLGFSPANFDAVETFDDHGYIYLNVLANMAQLHTLNVTTESIRKSIAEYSEKLMLSKDGRKARWRGGKSVTKASSDSSPNERSPDGIGLAQRAGKKRAYADRASNHGSGTSPPTLSRAGSTNKLAYVPLFFHKQDSADDDLTSEEQVTAWSSPQHEQVAGASSGLTSSGIRTTSSKRKQRDCGPIIFYNKAKFCTDLSGDQHPGGAPSQASVRYDTIGANPVGVGVSGASGASARHVGKGALSAFATRTTDVMEVDAESDCDSTSESESAEMFRFSPKTDSEVAGGQIAREQPDFEVSGLGGVQPSDHFRIEVQSRRKSTVGHSTPNATHFARNKAYPQRILDILRERNQAQGSATPVVEEEVVSTNHRSLPASTLPEPGTLFSMSSYTDSDQDMADASGAESDISDFEDDMNRPDPSTVPQMMHLSSHSSDEEESEEEFSSDGSLDFLAAARQVDPQTVHEREREYDADMAERLSEVIPAGSSAATAGGGSGFNSPEARVLSPASKRRRTGIQFASAKHAKPDGSEKQPTTAVAAAVKATNERT